MRNFHCILIWLGSILVHQIGAAIEPGVWDFEDVVKEDNYVGAVKNVFAGTEVNIRVQCESKNNIKVMIGYMIRRTPCWEEYLNLADSFYQAYYKNPTLQWYNTSSEVDFIKTKTEFETDCNDMINIHPYVGKEATVVDNSEYQRFKKKKLLYTLCRCS